MATLASHSQVEYLMQSSSSCACDIVPTDWYKLSIVDSSGGRQHLIVGSWNQGAVSDVREIRFNKRSYRMKLSWLLVLTVVALLLAPSLPAQNTAGDKANPPANFKKVSTLVRLPDWLPGLGTLYVDPASLPAGPYLGLQPQWSAGQCHLHAFKQGA